METQLRKALRGWGDMHYSRMKTELTALGTKPGAPAQHRHWDWDYTSCQSSCVSMARPLSVIVALRGGYVWVWPRDQYNSECGRTCKCTEDGRVTCKHPKGGIRVWLGPGDALVFTGDTMHAGGEGHRDQKKGDIWWRIHSHLWPVGYKEPSNPRSYLC